MKREWTDLEFADWTFLPSGAELLANKTGPTRLGFAVLFKFFQYTARFPLSMREVPATAVAYIAKQVGGKEPFREAIAKVVNAVFRVRLPHISGEATTACASDFSKVTSSNPTLAPMFAKFCP